jgi:hypothetical protein
MKNGKMDLTPFPLFQAINRQALILSPDPLIAQYPVAVKW